MLPGSIVYDFALCFGDFYYFLYVGKGLTSSTTIITVGRYSLTTFFDKLLLEYL